MLALLYPSSPVLGTLTHLYCPLDFLAAAILPQRTLSSGVSLPGSGPAAGVNADQYASSTLVGAVAQSVVKSVGEDGAAGLIIKA